MRVGVCGLGYVGCVTTACLARRGHAVVGLDVVRAKVDMVGSGLAPFHEPGLSELLAGAAAAGLLSATTDTGDAVRDTDAIILCVGTPTGEDDTPDLRFLAEASARVGRALRGLSTPYTVIIRSTIPPGTVKEVVIPALERESRRLTGGGDLSVLAVPEFLREGSAIADFDDPPFVVVGAAGPPSPRARQVVEALFPFPERHLWVELELAELLKCVCNAYHAVKTVFANEVGALCAALGIDGRRLMEILCEDRKLNTSAAYLRPGGPFGGSCLPKDLRALLYLARCEQVPALLLAATLDSNRMHVAQTTSVIEGLGARRVGLHGIAFKEGTDDLRESPMVTIAETLLDQGYDVRIFDPIVAGAPQQAPGKGRLYQRLVATDEELLRCSQVVVTRGGAAGLRRTAARLGLDPILVELGSRPLRRAPDASPAELQETLLPPFAAPPLAPFRPVAGPPSVPAAEPSSEQLDVEARGETD